MKILKTIKYLVAVAILFSFSACEMIDEPDMDAARTCTGCSRTIAAELD